MICTNWPEALHGLVLSELRRRCWRSVGGTMSGCIATRRWSMGWRSNGLPRMARTTASRLLGYAVAKTIRSLSAR